MRTTSTDRSARLRAAGCLVAAALVLAMVLSACGDQSPAATPKAGTMAAKNGGAPSQGQAKTAPAGAAKLPAQPSPCSSQLGKFLSSMAGLRAQLVAGLSYEQYVGEVQSIRAIYGQIPADEVALGCLRAAGTPGERGLNRYIAAGNTWSDCVEVPGCASTSIEGALQKKWHQASEELSKAQRGMRRLSAS
jgi:hypothetical protein